MMMAHRAGGAVAGGHPDDAVAQGTRARVVVQPGRGGALRADLRPRPPRHRYRGPSRTRRRLRTARAATLLPDERAARRAATPARARSTSIARRPGDLGSRRRRPGGARCSSGTRPSSVPATRTRQLGPLRPGGQRDAAQTGTSGCVRRRSCAASRARSSRGADRGRGREVPAVRGPRGLRARTEQRRAQGRTLVDSTGSLGVAVRCGRHRRQPSCIDLSPNQEGRRSRPTGPTTSSTARRRRRSSPDELQALEDVAQASGTYYATCPANPNGEVVVIENAGTCRYNNSAPAAPGASKCCNTPANPGLLIIVKRGSVELRRQHRVLRARLQREPRQLDRRAPGRDLRHSQPSRAA